MEIAIHRRHLLPILLILLLLVIKIRNRFLNPRLKPTITIHEFFQILPITFEKNHQLPQLLIRSLQTPCQLAQTSLASLDALLGKEPLDMHVVNDALVTDLVDFVIDEHFLFEVLGMHVAKLLYSLALSKTELQQIQLQVIELDPTLLRKLRNNRQPLHRPHKPLLRISDLLRLGLLLLLGHVHHQRDLGLQVSVEREAGAGFCEDVLGFGVGESAHLRTQYTLTTSRVRQTCRQRRRRLDRSLVEEVLRVILIQ